MFRNFHICSIVGESDLQKDSVGVRLPVGQCGSQTSCRTVGESDLH